MSLTCSSFKPDGPAEEKTMKTSTYSTWWREMGAISRGMMFIEGSIATPAALEPTDREGHAQAPAAPAPAPAVSPEASPEPARRTFSLYEEFLFLGGRPMTPGHNDDLDESFPQTYDAAPRRRTVQAQACAAC